MYDNYTPSQAKTYAAINVAVDVERHFARVVAYLDPRPSDRILEVGCGKGLVTRRTQELAPDTVGIDINPASIASGVTGNLKVMNAERLELDDASFDKAYCIHTIHTIPDLRGALAEMERVLKPGGRLLLVYPAEPIRGLFAIPNAIVVFKNPLRAREVHRHRLSPAIARRLVDGTRFEHVTSEFAFLTTPQFYTLLRKRA